MSSRGNPEHKRIFLTVKASPENSKKYGTSLCTAGLTESGEWIRLYPISYPMAKKLPRYSWIEVDCYQDKSHDKRKESYHIIENTLKRDDNTPQAGKVDWEYRNSIILPHLSPSFQELIETAKSDKITSLGLIKPTEILDFFKKNDDESNKLSYTKEQFQMMLTGGSIPRFKEVPHYSYKFRCNDNNESVEHSIVCLDWEMTSSYAKWRKKYQDTTQFNEKFRQKYYTEMITKKDLYFFMGTHFRFKTWMIIGLYYPPKEKPQENKTLFDFI